MIAHLFQFDRASRDALAELIRNSFLLKGFIHLGVESVLANNRLNV